MRTWLKFILCISSVILLLFTTGYKVSNNEEQLKHTNVVTFCDKEIVKRIIEKKSKTPYLDATLFYRSAIDTKTSTLYLSNGKCVTLSQKEAINATWRLDKGKIILSLGNNGRQFNNILFIQYKLIKDKRMNGILTVVLINNVLDYGKLRYSNANTISVRKLFQLVNMQEYPAYAFSAIDVYHTSIRKTDVNKAYIHYSPDSWLVARFDNVKIYKGSKETKGLFFVSGGMF